MITILIIWLLCGAIAIWRHECGLIYKWYKILKVDIRKSPDFKHKFKIKELLFILAGPLMFVFENEYSCWYIKIPKNK